MRAISVRPAAVRRSSTSFTVISKLAAGSYLVVLSGTIAAAAVERGHSTGVIGRPAAPRAATALRKSRRPEARLFMRISLHNQMYDGPMSDGSMFDGQMNGGLVQDRFQRRLSTTCRHGMTGLIDRKQGHYPTPARAAASKKTGDRAVDRP